MVPAKTVESPNTYGNVNFNMGVSGCVLRVFGIAVLEFYGTIGRKLVIPKVTNQLLSKCSTMGIVDSWFEERFGNGRLHANPRWDRINRTVPFRGT